MSLFKKLSLLFLASFFVLLFNIFPVNNKANAASFDVTLRVLEDNGNKDWNKPGVDKCYSGNVEVQVRDANSTRTEKYTSSPDSCSHAITVYNSPEAGEPTAYTVKLITPNSELNYIDVYYLTTQIHSTFKGSAISTRAVSPRYSNNIVTFGLKPVYKLTVAYVLIDKDGDLSIGATEDCYTNKNLTLEINGDKKSWDRKKDCTPRFTIDHDGQTNVRITLPSNSPYTYAGGKKSDDLTDHNVVPTASKNFTTINGNGTAYFFIKAKNDDGTNTCSDPKLTPDGKDGNTFHVKIKNPCNSEKKYQLRANPPGGTSSGWTAKISGNNVTSSDVITVGAKTTVAFNVKVNPPSNPTSGDHFTVVSATQKDKNANKDSIKLNTVIDRQQSCSRKDPVLSSPDKEKNGKKGETITYNVELKNNNSPCKDPADFDISVDKPAGWTVKLLKGNGGNLGGEIKNLPSGNSKLIKVKISSPNNAQNGTSKTITIKAIQKGHNKLKDAIALKYTVGQAGDDACTGSDIKPYFKCQANACVAVQACGRNSGGCSSAGGACGDTGGEPTTLSFVVGLDSIGTAGTSTVSLSNNSNKNPKHPQRALNVEVFDNSNQKVEEVEATINYVSDENTQNYGKFIGKVTLGDDFSTGNYIVKVKADGRLRRQISGIQRLEAGKINSMDPVNLIAGDIDNDNKIGILDYGVLISCSIFAKTDQAKALCSENESFKLLSDLNDDGENENTPNVDQLDYGYFIQEYSVQAGD